MENNEHKQMASFSPPPEDIIDLSSIPILRTETISSEIIKKVITEGKGTYFCPENGSKVLFKCEQRDAKGKLLNHYNRKITNSLVFGNPNNLPEYESVLKSMKIGEASLATITSADTSPLNLLFTVERIMYQLYFTNETISNFSTLVERINKTKEICKNYIDIAEENVEFYRCADGLYHRATAYLKMLPKKIMEKMTASDKSKLQAINLSLYLNKSYTSIKCKNYQAAKEAAENALKLEPENVKAIFRLAVACYNLKQHQAAVELFNKVQILEPCNPALKEYEGFIKDFKLKQIKSKTTKKSYAKFWEKYAQEEEKEKAEKKMREKIERKHIKLKEMENENIAFSGLEEIPAELESDLWNAVEKNE